MRVGLRNGVTIDEWLMRDGADGLLAIVLLIATESAHSFSPDVCRPNLSLRIALDHGPRIGILKVVLGKDSLLQ